jgi:cellulose synthase/poly-beta-1,6-N-acetylglucosamine synthase-like glycosyltransferase
MPYALEGIVNLDYPKNRIGIRVIVNDSSDNTFKQLMQFKKQYRDQYKYISIETYNLGTRPDERKASIRSKTIWVMGRLKNCITDALSLSDDLWFYMDSDIILQPDTLKLLVEADRDAIAGWCKTKVSGEGYYNFMRYNHGARRYGMDFDYNAVINAAGPVRMDLISGIQLFKTWLFRKYRVKFYQSSMSTTSEDEGAMRDMLRLDIDRWVHPKAFCHHIMCPEDLAVYKKRTKAEGLQFDFTQEKLEDYKLTDDAHLSSVDEAYLREKSGE